MTEPNAIEQAMTDEELITALRNGMLPVTYADIADRLEAISAALPHMGGVAPTHRHKKRGTEYVLIGIGKMQVGGWFDPSKTISTANVDMREVAIYRSVDDGSLWARPREEFEDGRFEALASPEPAPEPAKGGPGSGELHARLQEWRDEDHESALALHRDQAIELCEEYRASQSALTACQQEVERLRKHLDERLIVERALRRRAETDEARNAELVKALAPFARTALVADHYPDDYEVELTINVHGEPYVDQLLLGDFRRARAALGGQSNG